MHKRISAPALSALKDALTAVYWYKQDLKSFIVAVVQRPDLLAQVNWDDYKRNIVGTLVDCMARHQDAFQQELLDLMADVCEMRDFSHLERLDKGAEKARAARQAVEALNKLYTGHRSADQERESAERRRSAEAERASSRRRTSDRLAEVKQEYFELVRSDDEQGRGYALEKIVKELFDLFDLDPKASFRITGEQIDGAFTFDSTDYLFEAKWQKAKSAAHELDAFSMKVSRRLDNTLGLFLSLNGFTAEGVEAHSRGDLRLLLMDGADLMAVLDERIDLPDLLLRKRRRAAETGEIFLSASSIVY